MLSKIQQDAYTQRLESEPCFTFADVMRFMGCAAGADIKGLRGLEDIARKKAEQAIRGETKRIKA